MAEPSLHAPTDVYYKCRRFVFIASGLLALAMYVGIAGESDGSVKLFDLKLNSSEYLPIIFLILIFVALWQFWASWLVQTSEVRRNLTNRIDSIVTGVAAITVVVLYQHHFVLLGTCSIILAWTVCIGVWVFAIFGIAPKFLDHLLKQRVQLEEYTIQLLTQQQWILWFNPNNPGAKKEISFLMDGDIGKGKNPNETRWRVREGILEILNSQNQMFSRFRYNPSKNQFEHTNDEDTLSIRNQVIQRMP